ncbi:APC family permease [Actinoallomurus purpureus]|uniref:APC family permease n=1 Tax=Actinoallomurus purpureus TaxID=478114 RepID=UPI002092E045|nr:APC family permease [Actinoallomurus purpureus]MCO6008615.1 APC family permease [Actinoallomurus purpureus]
MATASPTPGSASTGDNRRRLGTFSLLMVGLSSIIGSGWLFGSWKAAQVAGPAALLAWVIGAGIMILIGLSYMELGSLFPKSGGMVRYAHYSHGSLVGYMGGWSNWIAIVSVIPIEAEASVQYMSSWKWHWAKGLYDGKELHPAGLAIAAGLVIVYFLLNYWTVKLYAMANNFIMIVKFAIPALTVIGLVASGFHGGNFTHHGGFAPYGWAAVLSAIATSGVVFAYNGFQSPINLAGEARNPGRAVPIALIGSLVIAAVVYVGLQTAFIGAVPGHLLGHGWSGINFNSPFADLAMAWNLNWLAVTLYADAFISPSGTGMTYTASTARMIQGMKENGYFPKILGYVHPKYGIPQPAMWFNLAVSFVFLFTFRGWGSLASVISVATVISYVTGPVSAMVLRRTCPDLRRPARAPALKIIAPAGFMFASLLLFWSTWPLTGEVIGIMALGLPLYVYYGWRQRFAGWAPHLRAGIWLVVYLGWMVLLSALGSAKFGGHGVLPYGVDMAVVAVTSLGFYAWGVRSGWAGPSREVAGELAAREADLAPVG